MKLLSRSTLILFMVAAASLRCAALTYTVGPGLGVAIPDDGYDGTLASMASVPINVPDAITVADINVTVAMNHTFIGELTIKLVSPTGTVVTLLNRPGSTAPDDGTDTPFGDASNLANAAPVTYDDGAAVSAETMGGALSDVQTVCGSDGICTFIPAPDTATFQGTLSSFDNEDASGTWTLYVGDSVFFDTGSIDTVTLTITRATAPCTPPPDNMVSWWPGDGNAHDIQDGNDGTLEGDATFASGKVGQAFSFDGTGDYVDVGDVDLPATFTIDAWINVDSLAIDRIIVAKGNAVGAISYFFSVQDTGNLRAVVVSNTGSTVYDTTASVITAGTWYYVAVTYDGNAGPNQKLLFYVNGALVAAAPTLGQDDGGAPFDISTALRIGLYADGGDAFDGLIDEVELFGRVLSQAEIQAIYDAGAGGKCKAVIYVSNNGNDTVEQFDLSGNPSLFTNSSLNNPLGLAFDAAGNLYVANGGDNTIQKFDANGTATLFADSADGVNGPQGIAFDHEGNLFVVNNNTATTTYTIQKIDPAGIGTLFTSTGLNQPYGIALDPSGNIYVANLGNSTILKYTPAGSGALFADSTDGLNGPVGLAFDSSGNLYAGNFPIDTITRLTPGGAGTLFADSADGLNGPYGLAFDTAGNLYVVNELTVPNSITKFDASGNGTLFANTGLSDPTFIAIKPGPLPPPPPIPAQRKFLNISSRASVGTGENVEIAGFIIQGDPPVTARGVRGVDTKTVIIRGIGPSLNITGDLDDPVLELHNGPTVVASNDNWGSAANAADITATGLAPTHPNEAAILITLNSDIGYTAILSGAGGTSGIGLVEVYDLDSLGNTHLANISTRANVLTGADVLIGGVILRGVQDRQVLLRAIGPSLTGQVTSPLADPFLELHDGNGALLEDNDDWGSSPNAAAITATGLAPTHAKESAILVTPEPGPYTAIVSGVGGTTGIGLVEAYRLGSPPP